MSLSGTRQERGELRRKVLTDNVVKTAMQRFHREIRNGKGVSFATKEANRIAVAYIRRMIIETPQEKSFLLSVSLRVTEALKVAITKATPPTLIVKVEQETVVPIN